MHYYPPPEPEPKVQVTNPEQVGCLMRAPSRGACAVICAGLLQSWMIAWTWAFRREDYEMIISGSRMGDPFRYGAAPGAEDWIRICHNLEGVALALLVVAAALVAARLRLWPHLVVLLPIAPLLVAAGLGLYYYLMMGELPMTAVWLRAWRAMALAWFAGNLWAAPWYRPGKLGTDTDIHNGDE